MQGLRPDKIKSPSAYKTVDEPFIPQGFIATWCVLIQSIQARLLFDYWNSQGDKNLSAQKQFLKGPVLKYFMYQKLHGFILEK